MGCLAHSCTNLISHMKQEAVNKVPIGLLISHTSLEKSYNLFDWSQYVQVAIILELFTKRFVFSLVNFFETSECLLK